MPRRIEFVILRTASSPTVAPHITSQRRSYLRLRGLGLPRHGLSPCCVREFTSALGAAAGLSLANARGSMRQVTAVHRVIRTRYKRRLVGTQPHHQLRHLVGFTETADGMLVQQEFVGLLVLLQGHGSWVCG